MSSTLEVQNFIRVNIQDEVILGLKNNQLEVLIYIDAWNHQAYVFFNMGGHFRISFYQLYFCMIFKYYASLLERMKVQSELINTTSLI